MSHIHWLGAGLSTHPGIHLLAQSGHPITVWNRTENKAAEAIQNTSGLKNGTASSAALDWDALNDAVSTGDVVISMLPGDLHVKVAKLCLEKNANFVSSSYISPEMSALNEQAKSVGVSLVNEVGLDPGIDHLFAHLLVHDYRSSDAYSAENRIYFRSFCGGVPAVPNAFKYKFSWSPFGVLKALTSPAQWRENGKTQRIDTPWKATINYTAPTANGGTEEFQAYPNRDSLPFMNDYQFDEAWHVEQFVRGTLRLAGWSYAWDQLFTEIESMNADNMQERLTKISDQLWNDHAYESGEPDRVVLVVELEARDENDKVVWHQARSIDDQGNPDGTSMARLVSHTVALAVQSTLEGAFTSGVHAAPANIALVNEWLAELSKRNSGFAHHVIC